MPKLKARRFTGADMLSTVRRESLLQWLTPAKDYFAQRGVMWETRNAECGAQNGMHPSAPLAIGCREGEALGESPDTTGGSPVLPAAEGVIDYEKLASVFMEPDEAMPGYLVDSLFLIQEMANPEAMDTLISARIERRLPTPASDDYTPIDLAVQTYLDAPALLEEVHNEHQLTRPRSFEYFQALAGGHHPEEVLSEEFDTSPPAPLPIGCGEGSDGWDAEGEASGEPPDMTGGVFPDGHPALPTAEKLRVLEARLNEWFIAHRRGGNCRVFLYPKRDEWWFLVRHGLPRKRENVIKDDGESATVLIRPQKHDVVVYDSSTGELRMHCCNQRELEEFRRAFGQHLFGDEDFFPRGEKYRPTPLINDGPASLVCSDIEGLERVTLREVAFCFRINGHEVVHRAENIFALVEQGIIRWPSIWCIGRATFEVKFADSRKTRRLTLIAPNRALYGRDEDSGLIDEWLKARGFAAQREENETDSLAVA